MSLRGYQRVSTILYPADVYYPWGLTYGEIEVLTYLRDMRDEKCPNVYLGIGLGKVRRIWGIKRRGVPQISPRGVI